MLYKETLVLARGVLLFLAVVFLLGAISAGMSWKDAHPVVSLAGTYSLMGWFVPILAIVFATSLPSECGEHARYALVRPVSRSRYALAIFAEAALALFIAYLLSALVLDLSVYIFTGFHAVFTDRHLEAATIALGTLHALAWYAIVALIGVATRQGWPSAAAAAIGGMLVFVVGQSSSPLGTAVRYIDALDPLQYYSSGVNAIQSHGTFLGPFGNLSAGTDAACMAAIAVVCFLLATLRWRTLQVA